MKVGIICLTPENLSADWILYEAGALSKTLDAKTRVCTYLLAGLESTNLKPPLGLFQWTKADKADTRKLIHTINKHLETTPIQESRLDTLFDKMWPDLEQKLTALPEPSQAPPPLRSTQEMVSEILELSRVMAPVVLEVKDEIDKARRRIFFEDAMRSATGVTGVNAFTTLASLASGRGIGSAFGSAFDAVPERAAALPSAFVATPLTTPPSESSPEPTEFPSLPSRPRSTDKK